MSWAPSEHVVFRTSELMVFSKEVFCSQRVHISSYKTRHTEIQQQEIILGNRDSHGGLYQSHLFFCLMIVTF